MRYSSEVFGEKACPCCGKHVFRSSHEGTPVYKCANPIPSCRWNRERSDPKNEEYARTPIGKTIAQVRRAHAELANEVKNDDR
jgi:hypothetical protein